MALQTWTQTYISPAYTSGGSWRSEAYEFKLTVEELSTSINYNTSSVRVTFTGWGINYFSYYDWSGVWAAVSVNGSRISYKDVPAIHPSGSSNAVTLCSWTGNITHGQDGTGSINVVAHFDGSSNVNYLPRIFDVTIGTKSLTTIPRKSTLTITPTTLDNSDRDPAVNITVNGASNTFTDKVEWRWRKKGGSWSGWINIPISNSKGTISKNDLGWTSKFNGTAGDIEIRNITYNEAGTELGSNTYPLTLVQGGVPLSLYQVGNSTGVSLMGSPVDGPGFYVHDKGPFVLKTITIGGNTYQVLAKE